MSGPESLRNEKIEPINKVNGGVWALNITNNQRTYVFDK